MELELLVIVVYIAFLGENHISQVEWGGMKRAEAARMEGQGERERGKESKRKGVQTRRKLHVFVPDFSGKTQENTGNPEPPT